MIADNDRSGYIGASDTERVIQSWDTKTFERWWLEKQGLYRRNFRNDYTMTGNALEHKILDSLGVPVIHDEQRIIGRLRVNIDARYKSTIYEAKTYLLKPSEDWKPPKKYYRQVYAEIYAFGAKNGIIVAYGVNQKEYRNWYLPIDKERLKFFTVEPNPFFLEKYVPRLHFLEHCLDTGEYPTEEKLASWAAAQKK